MKTIIPAYKNDKETRFDFETDYGDYYSITVKPNSMIVEKMVYNEDSGDWMSGEVGGNTITDDVKDYLFADLDKDPISYRTMQSKFVFTMFLS